MIVAGVDFGTLSFRVSIFDSVKGRLASATGEYPLTRKKEDPDDATQSHRDHMEALVTAMRRVLETAGVDGGQLAALALDATGCRSALGTGPFIRATSQPRRRQSHWEALSIMNFERSRPWLLAGLLLAAGGFPVHSQTSASNAGAAHQPARRVALNVVALDSAGKPVPDLTAPDFTIFDNGAAQQAVASRLNQSDGPRVLVILFDLMDSSMSSRGAIVNSVRTSQAHLPSTDSLYLYLLVADGSLYPINALPGTENAPEGESSSSWAEDIGPRLDAALRKVNRLKPMEIRVVPEARFRATYGALDDIRVRMAGLPGPKELLWVTYGVPSSIHFTTGWFDCGPYLRQLGARFVESGIAIYTADPGVNAQQGMLNRDALDILTGATGGRAFSTIDLNRAITQAVADARTS